MPGAGEGGEVCDTGKTPTERESGGLWPGRERESDPLPSSTVPRDETHGLYQKYKGRSLGQDLKAARTLYVIYYWKAAAYSL